MQAVKVFAVDNPAQVMGAARRAFSNQSEPFKLAGDAMHGIKRITEASGKTLSHPMKGAHTFLAFNNAAAVTIDVDSSSIIALAVVYWQYVQ